ncbi:TIGR01777 family oxidoreductase [Microbacterium awajiense]|uniref:TIGR01777 family oxidoreductase n=1 Tax=Microbacterium awajiense TaxID=415214 RepID=A0ABP7AI45_9MICO
MPPSPRRVAVIAGASGFVGRAVADAFRTDGYDLQLVGRSGPTTWDDPAALARAVDGADVVVNLAGTSVNCRYTDRNRDEILDSRVRTTRALHRAIAGAQHPPRVWLNASTATIYRHATDRPQTESTGERGEGFSVDVATAWERELFAGELPGTRRVALRMAIVIGDGPATRMLLTLARLGLAGSQHDGWAPPHRRYRGIGEHPTGPDRAPWYRTRGGQKVSWIDLDDAVRAIRFLRDDDQLAGPVNLASPHPTDNRTLMRTLRRVVGAPIGLPSARWMLEPAMWLLRTEPELVLKSRWVMPERLTDAGFAFSHPDLEGALRGAVDAHAVGADRTERTPHHAEAA